MRASNEHFLNVRVPRAGGRSGYLPPSFWGCALPEHKRGLIASSFSFSVTLQETGPLAALHCAHRATVTHFINAPSKLACFPSFGRASMLVYVRPSNEALLRARVPGAQDQRGYPSNLFIVGALRARRVARGPVDSLQAALLDFKIQF